MGQVKSYAKFAGKVQTSMDNKKTNADLLQYMRVLQ